MISCSFWSISMLGKRKASWPIREREGSGLANRQEVGIKARPIGTEGSPSQSVVRGVSAHPISSEDELANHYAWNYGSPADQHASLLVYSANQGAAIWYPWPISAQENGIPGQSGRRNPQPPANEHTGIHTPPFPSQLVHVNLVPPANHYRGLWCSWPISTQESHTLSQSVHGIPLLPSQSVHGDLVPLANQRVGIQYPRPISMHTPPAQAANGLLRAPGAGPMGCRGRGHWDAGGGASPLHAAGHQEGRLGQPQHMAGPGGGCVLGALGGCGPAPPIAHQGQLQSWGTQRGSESTNRPRTPQNLPRVPPPNQPKVNPVSSPRADPEVNPNPCQHQAQKEAHSQLQSSPQSTPKSRPKKAPKHPKKQAPNLPQSNPKSPKPAPKHPEKQDQSKPQTCPKAPQKARPKQAPNLPQSTPKTRL